LSEDVFLPSFSILIDNFSFLKADRLNSLSNEVLKQLFSSDKLKLSNEEIKQGLFLKLIEKDPNKRILLKNV
jgi:hypothetical protein